MERSILALIGLVLTAGMVHAGPECIVSSADDTTVIANCLDSRRSTVKVKWLVGNMPAIGQRFGSPNIRNSWHDVREGSILGVYVRRDGQLFNYSSGIKFLGTTDRRASFRSDHEKAQAYEDNNSQKTKDLNYARKLESMAAEIERNQGGPTSLSKVYRTHAAKLRLKWSSNQQSKLTPRQRELQAKIDERKQWIKNVREGSTWPQSRKDKAIASWQADIDKWEAEMNK